MLTPYCIQNLKFKGKFIAGSVVDFLAYYFGKDYTKAVDHVLAHYTDGLQKLTAFPLATLRDSAITDFQNARLCFEQVMQLRRFMLETPVLHEVRTWLKKRNIESQAVPNMVFAATGQQLIDTFGPVPGTTLSLETPYAIFPFFNNPYTPSYLIIRDVRSNDEPQILSLNPSAYAVFGIHAATQDAPVTVYPDYMQTIAEYSFARSVDGQPINCVAISLHPGEDENPFRLESGLFVVNEDLPLEWLIKVKSIFIKSQCAEAWNKTAFFSVPLFLTNKFITAYRQHDLHDLPLRKLVEAIKQDTESFTFLTDYLVKAERKDIVKSIVKLLDHGRSFNLPGGIKVEEISQGYMATKEAISVSFTNFTIKIDSNLYFDDSSNIFHMGRLQFRGQEYPLEISRSALVSSKGYDFESFARNALMKAGYKETQILPVVTDSTYKQALRKVVNQQIAQSPKIKGTAHFGWDLKNHKFVTPTWEATAFGINFISRAYHPERQLLKKYFTLLLSFNEVDTISVGNSLLCLMAGMITRSFLDLKQKAVMIKKSPKAIEVLETLCFPLGQLLPIEINPNVRFKQLQIRLDGVEGYPIHVISMNEEYFSQLEYPLFCLSKEGMVLPDDYPGEALAQQCHTMLIRLTVALLRSNADYLKTLFDEDCEKHGRQILKALLKESYN